MAKVKTNYSFLNDENYLNGKEFDENYALITHYIQLQGRPEADNYRQKLIDAGIKVDGLPTTVNFNRQIEKPNLINFVPLVANHNFTFIDLFAGIGGFRIAAQDCGGTCVFSSEWDIAAKQTYFQNHGEVPFGDIAKEENKAIIPEQFDLLCAGFPCQPFSNAGLKRGIEDTRGTLFYHIADILQRMRHGDVDNRPRAVLLENVRGLISNNEGNTIQTVLRTITGMGYRCNVPQDLIDNGPVSRLKAECSKMVLSAKDYGVPQNRPRIYIVLWRDDLDIDHFNYPEPSNEATHVGDILEDNVDAKYTISDKLWAGHQRRRIENAAKGNGFGFTSFTADSPYTSTISRRYYKDGSEILIEQPRMNPRKITPREAANLQGFPQTFKVPASDVKAYQQFGNSVAVPVVRQVISEIVNQILGV